MMKVWGIAFADVEGLDQEELLSRERSLLETMDRSDSIVRSFFPSHQDGGPCSEIFHLCRERCARLIEEEDSDGLSDMTDHRRPEELPSREGLPVDKPRLSGIVGGDVPLSSLPDIWASLKTPLTGREKNPCLGWDVKIPVVTKNSREGMGSP